MSIQSSKETAENDKVVTIKKYANRRLYNTATSSYVTLDNLCQMVRNNIDFVVIDARSGEDITRAVLTQIIVEEENKGEQSLLPINFLRQIIGFYGDSMKQNLLPTYLDASISSFINNQEKLQDYMNTTLDSVFPFNHFEELNKQNMALVGQMMQMFNPFATKSAPASDRATPSEQEQNLLRQIEILEAQLNALKRK